MQNKINRATLFQFLFLIVMAGFLMMTSFAYGKGAGYDFMRGISEGMSVASFIVIIFLQIHKNDLFMHNRLVTGWNKTIDDFEAWRDSVMQYLPEEIQAQLTKKPEAEQK